MALLALSASCMFFPLQSGADQGQGQDLAAQSLGSRQLSPCPDTTGLQLPLELALQTEQKLRRGGEGGKIKAGSAPWHDDQMRRLDGDKARAAFRSSPVQAAVPGTGSLPVQSWPLHPQVSTAATGILGCIARETPPDSKTL